MSATSVDGIVVLAFLEKHWAEFGALGLALGAMLTATALLDLFGPKEEPEVVTRRMIFLVDAPIGFIVSYTLWTSLDVATPDPLALIIFVCVITCALAALGAPYASRVAKVFIKWKWPGLDVNSIFDRTPLK